MNMTKRMADAERVLLWKAALTLMDGRATWPRALKQAIAMIEARDPKIKQLYQKFREKYGAGK